MTAPLQLTEVVRDRGSEQLASLRTAAMMSRRVADTTNESLGGGSGKFAEQRNDAVRLEAVAVLQGNNSCWTQRLVLQWRFSCPYCPCW